MDPKKLFLLVPAGIVLAVLLYLLWLPWVPALKSRNPATTALIERREKQARAKKITPKTRMIWRNLRDISPHLTQAVLLAEDDTFYRHRGFDFEQIVIAVKINWKKKRYAYGGSTLTQQLARTLYLSSRKNLLRKLKEALITVWMEAVLPKKRILELYLNAAEWGDGIYGAEAAARHYYGKGAGEIDPQEAVALASILPSPRKWSPLRETPFMLRRRKNLLSRMGLKEEEVKPEETEEEKIQVLEQVPEDENGFEIPESTETEIPPPPRPLQD